ncbi:hypothetical protein [Breznakiella homolactica]|uniref:Uncharacterized protein n=1 Tax=Breznakiella homolactica TaxID=2798577 RepID=A0A7T7XRD1_9SPIR|nr:hypothetical protein [Breznakiella homolactica]QQO11080.1 hypothetical protein JFL75_09230 [Breznakiella homolactica]
MENGDGYGVPVTTLPREAFAHTQYPKRQGTRSIVWSIGPAAWCELVSWGVR